MILPGVIASSGVVASSFESIATSTVGSGGVASVTFSSIPQTFAHLQIRYIGRDNRTSNTLDTILLQFNSSTTSYYTHYLLGNGTTAAANGFSGSGIEIYRITGPSATSGIFGAGVVDILNYTSTTNNKTTRSLAGADLNGSGEIVLGSGLWYATPAAISSVKLSPTNATLFSEFSSFALYGIKA